MGLSQKSKRGSDLPVHVHKIPPWHAPHRVVRPGRPGPGPMGNLTRQMDVNDDPCTAVAV